MKTTMLKHTPLCLALCGLLVLSSCEQLMKVEKPEKTISGEQATKMSGRFVKEIGTLMASPGPKEADTAAVNMQRATGNASAREAGFQLTSHTYYTVEELEHYFTWAKQEARKKGYELEGFRFYFGIYSEDEAFGDRQNLMTVFISPAGRKETQKGSFINIPFMAQDIPDDIEDIDPYNYGGNGHPPKAKYGD